MLVLPIVITALCAAGMYASVFLLRKWVAARRGELREKSVVQTPYATLIPGVPNMVLGVIFYGGVIVATWIHAPLLCAAAFVASLLAVASSIYLAYRLQRTLQMACPYCWTAHAVNGALVLLIALRCYLFG